MTLLIEAVDPVTPAGNDRVTLNVELQLRQGEFVALLGPAASGKTMFIDLLSGTRTLCGGVLRLDPAIRPASNWEHVALIPQDIVLADELTIAENIHLGALLLGREPPDCRPLTDRLGLSPLLDRRPEEVSVGERQRTMIVRALAEHPQLVLADEPTAHQDAGYADTIIEVLLAYIDRGGTCLIATNDTTIARRAQRIVPITP